MKEQLKVDYEGTIEVGVTYYDSRWLSPRALELVLDLHVGDSAPLCRGNGRQQFGNEWLKIGEAIGNGARPSRRSGRSHGMPPCIGSVTRLRIRLPEPLPKIVPPTIGKSPQLARATQKILVRSVGGVQTDDVRHGNPGWRVTVAAPALRRPVLCRAAAFRPASCNRR
jgi:hypothetical protein